MGCGCGWLQWFTGVSQLDCGWALPGGCAVFGVELWLGLFRVLNGLPGGVSQLDYVRLITSGVLLGWLQAVAVGSGC